MRKPTKAVPGRKPRAAKAPAPKPRVAKVSAPSAEPAEVQPVANPDRGEHELKLAGVTYRLRPSHTALKAIEQKTERATLRLVHLGNAADLSIDQLGAIAGELIRTGAEERDTFTRNVSDERIGELILEEGLPAAMSRLTLCLLDAATGGMDAAGNRKAATA